MSRKALVVVDVQKDFIDGALANPSAETAMPTIYEVIKWADSNDFDIYYTQDTHTSEYLKTQEGKNLPVEHCIENTDGWKIDKQALKFGRSHGFVATIQKQSFGYPNWIKYNMMDGYNEIVLIGFVSSICVVSNALIIKSCAPEVPMTFITDASAGLSPINHAAAIEVMQSCQIRCVTWKEFLK